MNIFLFMKQLVDMFYLYPVLDYGMVLILLGLICMNIKKDFHIVPADCVIVVLGGLCAFSFLRNMSGYGVLFKVCSAYLLYVLGRLSYSVSEKYAKALVISAYIVIYSNLLLKLAGQGTIEWAFGAETFSGMYYFKTDLAGAVIIAATFIFFLGKNKWLKYITVFAVAPYMIIIANSRITMMILAMVYFVFGLEFMEQKTGRAIVLNAKLAGAFAGIAVVVVGILIFVVRLPVFRENNWIGLDVQKFSDLFNTYNLMSRDVIWGGILAFFFQQSIWGQIWGIDLISEAAHNVYSCEAHSTYVKILYSTGYLGTLLFIALLILLAIELRRVENRKLYYLMFAISVIFLGIGLTYTTWTSTQYSWWFMLFAGGLVSANQRSG